MGLFWKSSIATAFATAVLCSAFAQDGVHADPRAAVANRATNKTRVDKTKAPSSHGLTSDDRLSLLSAALDTRVQREADPDCSHLVHAIYEAAGFPYDYTPSSGLYAGVGSFQRVRAPLPGDLVVWHGHVGMVIKPSKHIFFSYLSSGPGTDDYEAPYWKGRGHPRFYRYVKSDIGYKNARAGE